MKVTFAQNIGFCSGVSRAIQIALNNISDDTYVLGELTNNEHVIAELKKRGVKIVHSLDDVDCGTVIIRSHGASEDTYNYAHRRGLRIIDATCPFVDKIHRIIREHYLSGYHIIILGERTHPEVVASAGWCENTATIVSSEIEVESLPRVEKACVVSQTTFSRKKYLNIVEKINKLCLKTVEFFDTICYTTTVRQSEAQLLAANSDCILVLGSANSSNTMKLVDISRCNCGRTFLVENVSDLENILFYPDDRVGVLAGASTPEELIMEVKVYMSQNVGEVQVSEEFKNNVEESLMSYKEGKKVKGTVISADEKGIRVNIGGKYDGIIYKAEANIDGSYDPADFVEGMEVEAIIVGKKTAESEDCIPLSKKRVDLIREGDKVVDTIRNGEEFSLISNSDTKGGLLGKIGTYTVFVPASQIREVGYPKDLKAYVKKPLRLTALEIDDAKHKIVASQKKILVAERKEKEEIFWTHVVPNVVVTGTVKRFADFGAFVSVDGFDCLAHVVDLSWNHIKSPDEVLKIGESYDFLVLSADREKGKVSLGYKQLQPHPFAVAMEKHPVGSVAEGKVVSIVPFGAFVQIEAGVEGLVHVSEAARSFVKNINEVVKVGDTVNVKILAVDVATRRITLSMKACLPEETDDVLEGVSTERTEEEKAERNKRFANRPNRKPVEKKAKAEDDERKEWNESASNNPFADLLKNININD